ncbi:ImmA/IrrE family metallo-endopeptidase [Halorhodospira neutriphila]|uniref:ImmA/IrrE family metallo-endopeptidase n=1 Tax=Halorhodospira neutriphila TaxID=168379 RepID=UPI001F5B313C|nr:ImmA/IrrE family metallo-endopeptidase [Halorhodospira neutriphila]
MAEEVRRSRRLIGEPGGLQFELDLDPADEYGLAQGKGQVFLKGEPVWITEDAHGQELALSWTWVDLLAFLGRWWPWLMLEEDYPLPVTPLYPAYFLQEAETRWEDLPEEQVDEEEEEAHRFLARHDLAEGFKGLFLPSLLLLRQGEVCLISATAIRSTRVRPWAEVRDTLEAVGDYLAEHVAESINPRAQQALAWWRNREARLAERGLEITTALSGDERAQLTELGLAEEEWQWPEIRTVARMSRGAMLREDRLAFLLRIAEAPARETPELDRLGASLNQDFQESGAPYKQGYWMAGWLRQALGIADDAVIEPRDWLEAWGVQIEEVEYPGCPVDAVTAWGEEHGPVVILNRARGSHGAHEHGERATLAHEIAHLLLDREGALPAGEVLGGRAPEYPEKRARAFQAELLLPRAVAGNVVQESASLEEAARYLQDTYRVSTELLAWQINNSGIRSSLTAEEKALLEQWKTGAVKQPGASKRVGFLKGQIEVPEDFDRLGGQAILDAFHGEDPDASAP